MVRLHHGSPPTSRRRFQLLITLVVVTFIRYAAVMHRDLWNYALRTLLIVVSLWLSLGALRAAERGAKAESFATFWTGFKTAVAKGDKEAVVAATHLPAIYPNDRGAKAAFLKSYPSIFTKDVRKCFTTAKPVRTPDRDSYSVFCGDVLFYFEKVNGTYKFTDYGPND